MNSVPIEGQTRVIGESQGYIGLSLRDGTINDSVNGPCTPSMTSKWKLSDEDRAAIASGAHVYLEVLGTVHPPVLVYVK